MKILILGERGMLGHELNRVFQDYDITALNRGDLDITDETKIEEIFDKFKPNLVINAAAYTAVDGAEQEEELATQVNGHAVEYLVKAAKKQDAILVHYSTDYVFDGKKRDGYSENDPPSKNPSTAYGRSKLLGEQNLKKYDKYYLIRTSWIFGKNGRDFIDTMTRLASERDELRVVNDQHGKPTYALDLANATLKLIEDKFPFGTYHLVNEGGATTWYEYAKKIIELYGKRQGWGSGDYPRIVPVNSQEFRAPAKRPEYSILNNTKFPLLRPWQEALEEYMLKKGMRK